MKRLSLLLAILVAAMPLFAGLRSEADAIRVASEFMAKESNGQRMLSAGSRLQLSYIVNNPQTDEAAAYLFQNGENEGYVIVSADDKARPVLGYATTGRVDTDEIPENMQVWLDYYAQQIAQVSQQDLRPTLVNAAASGSSRNAAQAASIQPLLGNIVWNQGGPFWNQCPYDSDGQRSYTGCVATATAQVMRFWKTPAVGTGSHSYSWKRSNGSTRTLSADFSQSVYDWDNMLPDYNYYVSYNSTQANAVAKLMSDVGIASDMQYSSNGSGTQTELACRALYQYFGYDKSIRIVRPDFVGDEEFASQMLAELQNGRPVLMSGATTQQEGHAFVCDGYDGEGFFHINWGWGGSSNGYFALSALDPDKQGMGGAASGQGFHVGVLAAMDIRPDEGGSLLPTSLGCTEYYMTTSTTTTTDSNINIHAEKLCNIGLQDWEGGYVGVAVFDNNDQFYSWLCAYDLSDGLPVGYYYPSVDFPGTLNGIADGEYTLIPIMVNPSTYEITKLPVGYGFEQELHFTVSGSTVVFGNDPGDQPGGDPEPEEYPITNFEAHVEGTAICFSFECDAPYYHVKVYNDEETLASSVIDFNNARLSNVPAGTWTVWVRPVDANQEYYVGEAVSADVVVEPAESYAITNLVAYSEGNCIYFDFESPAPYFHVKVYNDEETRASGVIDFSSVVVNNVPDGTWTVWVRPVDETKQYYLDDAVSVEVVVDTRVSVTLVLSANDDTMGTVSGGGQYYEGDTVHIAAVAEEGYHFVGWSDGDSNAERDYYLTPSGTTEPRTIELTATFEPDVVIDYTVYNLEASALGSSVYFSFECEAPYYHVKVYNDSETLASGLIDFISVRVDSVPDGVWTIWVRPVDAAQEYYLGDAVTTSVTVDTKEPVTIVLAANDSVMGKVYGAGEYFGGDTVRIVAQANEGYHFLQWSDGSNEAVRDYEIPVVGSTEPRTIELIAIFEQDEPEAIETLAAGSELAPSGSYTLSGYRTPKLIQGINVLPGKIVDVRK
ncbi:MAG: C10 family peptidase [Bacteroidales bacterium]|nr:C10 family peptidase [Candidatus Liminaster caballi]